MIQTYDKSFWLKQVHFVFWKTLQPLPHEFEHKVWAGAWIASKGGAKWGCISMPHYMDNSTDENCSWWWQLWADTMAGSSSSRLRYLDGLKKNLFLYHDWFPRPIFSPWLLTPNIFLGLPVAPPQGCNVDIRRISQSIGFGPWTASRVLVEHVSRFPGSPNQGLWPWDERGMHALWYPAFNHLKKTLRFKKLKMFENQGSTFKLFPSHLWQKRWWTWFFGRQLDVPIVDIRPLSMQLTFSIFAFPDMYYPGKSLRLWPWNQHHVECSYPSHYDFIQSFIECWDQPSQLAFIRWRYCALDQNKIDNVFYFGFETVGWGPKSYWWNLSCGEKSGINKPTALHFWGGYSTSLGSWISGWLEGGSGHLQSHSALQCQWGMVCHSNILWEKLQTE